MNIALLTLAALIGSAISGAVGMGGGAFLIAVMTMMLAPGAVVPIHGLVQFTSNGSRALTLREHIYWPMVARFCPTMVLGALIGRQLYQGADLPWFKPAIGAFILISLAWKRLKPKHLTVPLWVLIPAGVGGGFLTIAIGAAGPYLAAFFLGGNLERKQIVATKAAIQTFGHLLKVPVFLDIGFNYGAHVTTIVPLIAAVIIGTRIGTSLLGRMSEGGFQKGFQLVLGALGLKLVLSPWW